MKPIQDMTEPEFRKLTSGIIDAVKARLPEGTGFYVLLWPSGAAFR